MLTYLEFMAKQHTQVPAELLTHTALMVGELALRQPQLTDCAYAFSEDVTSTLCTLGTPALVEFLEKHLQLLNENEWGHKPVHFRCFLLISLKLEEEQCALSAKLGAPLMIQAVRALGVVSELMGQSSQSELEIVGLSIRVMGSLLKNPLIMADSGAMQQLNLSAWRAFIDTYRLYYRESAIVVAASRLASCSLPL